MKPILRFVSIILLVAFVFTLAACSSSSMLTPETEPVDETDAETVIDEDLGEAITTKTAKIISDKLSEQLVNMSIKAKEKCDEAQAALAAVEVNPHWSIEEMSANIADNKAWNFFESRTGGTFIQYSNIFTIGVPANYNEEPMNIIFFFINMDEYTYGPSDYDFEHAYNFYYQEDIVDILLESNPNTIVYISMAVGLDYDRALRAIATLNVGGIDKVICGGWSAGGNNALTCAAKILEEYPQFGTPYIFFDDSNHTQEVASSVYRTLEGHDLTCLIFTSLDHPVKQHKHWCVEGITDRFAIIKADFTYEPGQTLHIQCKVLAIADNVFGYILGTVDELPGSMYNAQYQYGYHNYDVGDVVWTNAEDVFARFYG